MELLPYRRYVVYDGTNSADVLTLIEGEPGGTWSIHQENSSGLTIKLVRPEVADYFVTIPIGYYVLNREDTATGFGSHWSSEWVGARYHTRESLVPEPMAPSAPAIQSGTAAVPTLLANATSSPITVSFPDDFADENYNATAQAWSGSNLLGALSVESLTITNAGAVQVTVKNNGLLSLSGAVLVYAVR